jgi:hypothetical protein
VPWPAPWPTWARKSRSCSPEDLGGILTGQGTDPNTGLLLIVIAAAFWPPAASAGLGRDFPEG